MPYYIYPLHRPSSRRASTSASTSWSYERRRSAPARAMIITSARCAMSPRRCAPSGTTTTPCSTIRPSPMRIHGTRRYTPFNSCVTSRLLT